MVNVEDKVAIVARSKGDEFTPFHVFDSETNTTICGLVAWTDTWTCVGEVKLLECFGEEPPYEPMCLRCLYSRKACGR